MSDLPPNMSQLTRKFASLAVPGFTEARPDNHLLIKSLDTIPSIQPNMSGETGQKLRMAQAEARRRENELAFSQIESLGFNLFTTDEIDALAVILINNYKAEGPYTVRDLHLGPHNESQICETCSGSFRSCYGHYGRVILPPLMHPLAISHIILTLSCVCNHCGGLLITRDDIEKNGINRLTGLRKLQAIAELVSRLSKGCRRYQNVPGMTACPGGVPIFGSVKEMTLARDYDLPYRFTKKGTKFYMTATKIQEIFESISDEDAESLGYVYGSHPSSTIMERLLIIPYRARPDLLQDDQLFPDDISSIYSEIIKKANEYWDPDKPAVTKRDTLKDLYFKLRHFMRNEGGQYKQGSVKIYTDITTRLQGKTALIRAHIMGKRVNFAGRTVAAPGGYLSIFEIGIPEMMAVNLTRPIQVNELNRAELQSRYESRRVKYITPRVGRFAGNRIMITNQFVQENPNYQVQLGDVVERILEDGDYVYFNRQPTLNRQNQIALRAKIIKGRVIMINLSLTSPQNLDFDGDEVNIHVPQTIEAYSEIETLMSVQASLMNEQTNEPMIGVVYNSLTGAYLLTKDENTAANRQLYRQALKNHQTEVNRLREYQQSLIPPQAFAEYQSIRRVIGEQETILEQIVKRITEVTTIDPAGVNVLEEQRTQYANNIIQLNERAGQIQKIIQNVINTNTDRARLVGYDNANSVLKNLEQKVGMLDPVVFNQCLIYVAHRSQFDTLKQRVQQEGMIWGTGKALASAVFPVDFYYKAKGVLVENGVLKEGFLSKSAIGREDGSIIVELYKQYENGATFAGDFIDDIQVITREFLNMRGFTVGYDDCISDDPDFQNELNRIIQDAEIKVLQLSGPSSNKILEEAKEREIVKALNIVKDVGDSLRCEEAKSLTTIFWSWLILDPKVRQLILLDEFIGWSTESQQSKISD